MLTTTKDNKPDLSAIPENPITKKWAEIEKKKKRNANFKQKIDTLHQSFQRDILPIEKKVVELLEQETRLLMSFMPRKSLTDWQREELQTWLESNLDTLSRSPFGNGEITAVLRQEYSDALVNSVENFDNDYQFSEQEIAGFRVLTQEMFDGEKCFSDEELAVFLRDPSLLQKEFQAFMEKCDSEEAEEFDDIFGSDDEENDPDEDYFQQAGNAKKATQQDKLKSIFSSSKLNKLYKKLANRLHPDKEANPHLKAQKSELMAQLVKAKKNNDAYTLISMFHQFIPDSEMALFDGSDEELSQALLVLLNQKLHELDDENNHNKYSNGISSMVWQKLGGRSKKVIQENIAMQLGGLDERQERLNYFIDEVKTVKQLKAILSERYDQRRHDPFNSGPFSLDELDAFFG